MEILRDLGLEEKAVAQAAPQHLMANNVFCESLAGEEFGRLYSWGNHPLRKADYDLASPVSICDLPQNLLEPILLEAAASAEHRSASIPNSSIWFRMRIM